jgi:transaldolase
MYNRVVSDLAVKLFADGANKARMLELSSMPLVKGFTTNPTLMRQSGVTDYEAFAKDILYHLPDLPISFEIFSDDSEEMYQQALHISQWGDNVYVKIPITNTLGDSSVPLLRRLVRERVKVNVTAVMTTNQVLSVRDVLAYGTLSYVSVFAGRIADTGLDPLPIVGEAVRILSSCKNVELIWASSREIFNVVQANDIGCHIITLTYDLLQKLKSLGRDLDALSLDTVRMFRNDAIEAGFNLPTRITAAHGGS